MSDQLHSFYTLLKKTHYWNILGTKLPWNLFLPHASFVHSFVLYNYGKNTKWICQFLQKRWLPVQKTDINTTWISQQEFHLIQLSQQEGGLSCYRDLVDWVETNEARKILKSQHIFCNDYRDSLSMCITCFICRHKKLKHCISLSNSFSILKCLLTPYYTFLAKLDFLFKCLHNFVNLFII